jgi:hypothetical protein
MDFPTEGLVNYKNLKLFMNDLQVRRRQPLDYRKPLIVWFHGESGYGKSLIARKFIRDYMNKYNLMRWYSFGVQQGTHLWFDGLEPDTECILYDQFTAGMFGWSKFLSLTSGYATSVPVKGSYVNYWPQLIVFTCILRPDQEYRLCYGSSEMRQLDDRLTKIVWLKDPVTPSLVNQSQKIVAIIEERRDCNIDFLELFEQHHTLDIEEDEEYSDEALTPPSFSDIPNY